MESFPGLYLDGIVYLRAAPETCHRRLHIRHRSEEESVPLTYLQSIHKRHEDWLIDKSIRCVDGVAKGNTYKQLVHITTRVLPQVADVPVLVLDCDAEFEKDEARCAQMLAQLHEFVAKLDRERDE